MVDFEKLIASVATSSPEQFQPLISQFNGQFDKTRIIPEMSHLQKEALWNYLFARLKDPLTNTEVVSDLLNALRILSRDKSLLEQVVTDEMISCLLERSGLESKEGPIGLEHLSGMKVIFNIIFQSEIAQNKLISAGLLKCLVRPLQSSHVEKIPSENLLFLLKIFFIITALQKRCGSKVRDDLGGLNIIIKYTSELTNSEDAFDNTTADILSELLKLLYNLIHDIDLSLVDNSNSVAGGHDKLIDSKIFADMCEITRVVRRCLLHEVECPERRLNVQAHAVHLLCAVPSETFNDLIMETLHENYTKIRYEDKDLAAIEEIVCLLDLKLNDLDRSPVEPILVALCKMVSSNRAIRKFLKGRILPPLTAQDLKQRPEIGNTIRNKLCRLIHTPAGTATKTAATLIFILCKENVGRMIKYTGYGNAAGLLADHGLLMGGRGSGRYSEDSDSDTAEYEELREKINNVEGWMKPEEPFLEMTEEQKEYEAMKLVQHIHALTTNKTIQPCRIGADGKPEPIEHVLELQEGLEHVKNAIGKATASDSDSD